jgi:hypothetical protein
MRILFVRVTNLHLSSQADGEAGAWNKGHKTGHHFGHCPTRCFFQFCNRNQLLISFIFSPMCELTNIPGGANGLKNLVMQAVFPFAVATTVGSFLSGYMDVA